MPPDTGRTTMNTSSTNRLVRVSRAVSISKQTGVTLIETMISLALSLVVTSAMVVLMANSLGTATRIIQMSQMTDELRNAMSMMTRDVRRANYSSNSAYCYANSECGDPGGMAEQFELMAVELEGVPLAVRDIEHGKRYQITAVSNAALSDGLFNGYGNFQKQEIPSLFR